MGLGFVVERGEPLKVTPPSWRSDIEGAADLVEEVVRIHGIEHVPSVPMTRPHAVARPVLTGAQRRLRTVRRLLAARGFNETVSYSFIPRAHAALFGGGDEARQLENPIAADLDAMRPSVLPSLLAAAARNQARGISELMLFEIGPAFESGMPGAQKTVAAGLRIGGPARDWAKSTHAADAFDVKADMLTAIEAAMGSAMSAPIKAGAPGWYHPGRAGTLALGRNLIGHFGELHPKIAQAFDIKGAAAAFEIFLGEIPEPKAKGKARSASSSEAVGHSKGTFAPSSFQPVERDFAFVVDTKVAAEDLLKPARMADRNLIEAVAVFDVYEGTGVPEGKKSLAISVRMQPKDKTLTDAEIEAVAGKIVAAVAKATGGILRT